MKSKLLLIALLVWGLVPVANSQENLDLYLLIGQSNMAGRGKLDDAPLRLDSIYMLDKNNQWVQAVEPLHFDKSVAGTGLAASFAVEVRKPGHVVGLIPCAVGGSPIESWKPNAVDPATKKTVYDDAVKRAKIALKSGQLKGILWHQGESNSKGEQYKLYEEQFEQLLVNLSRDLNIDIDTIPLITGELAYFLITKPGNEGLFINAVHHQMAQKKMNRYCVTSEGLNHIGDGTHFDTPSLRELGHRYAKGYKIVEERMNK